MPRTELTAQTISSSGVDQAGVPGTSEGHMFANDARKFIIAANVGAGSRDLTIVTPQTVNGLAVDEQVVSVPAGERRICGPFPTQTFNQPTGATDAGKVYLDFPAAQEADLEIELYSF